MRVGSFIRCLPLLACGCALNPSRVVVDADLAGMFGASFDFRAEARLRLKSDHTFEMYSVYWRNLRTNPASEVRESGAHDSGRWTLKGATVVLRSASSVSSSLKIQADRDILCLVRGKLRYRKLYPEQPNQMTEPASTAATVPNDGAMVVDQF